VPVAVARTGALMGGLQDRPPGWPSRPGGRAPAGQSDQTTAPATGHRGPPALPADPPPGPG